MTEIDEIDEIREGIVAILQKDIEFCLPFIKTDAQGDENQQFWRRTYVRTFMARVEGTANAYKDIAIRIARVMKTSFTQAELALLNNEHYQINSQGEAYPIKAKVRTEDNIKFAVVMFAKAHGTSFSLATGDAGWRQLVETIRVRDRLTHPRKTADLNVSYEEILHTIDAHAWFLNQLAACTSHVTPFLESFRAQLKSSSAKK
jgi:hypothetical protein